MITLGDLPDQVLARELANAQYFSGVAWQQAKRAAAERLQARRRLAEPLTRGWIGYWQLRRTNLADEVRMFLVARADYRARIADIEKEQMNRLIMQWAA